MTDIIPQENRICGLSPPKIPNRALLLVKHRDGGGLFTVRVHDSFDIQWYDVIGATNVDWKTALHIWLKCTNGGRENLSYEDKIYYSIFPSDTAMLFSNGFGQRGL